MPILSNEYSKLVVFNIETKEELAVITDESITTTSKEIVIKLTPKYD